MEFVKELSSLVAGWIGDSYQRIHKDLTEKPLVTVVTIFILAFFGVSSSLGFLVVRNELYKKDSTIIFDKLNNDEN